MVSFRSKAPSSSFDAWRQSSTFAFGSSGAVWLPSRDHQGSIDLSCSSASVAARVYHLHKHLSHDQFHLLQRHNMRDRRKYFVGSVDHAACNSGHRTESLWTKPNIAVDSYCKLNMGWEWVAMAPRRGVSEHLRGCRSSRWRPYLPGAAFCSVGQCASLQIANFPSLGAGDSCIQRCVSVRRSRYRLEQVMR